MTIPVHILCAASLFVSLTVGPPAHGAYLDQDIRESSLRLEQAIAAVSRSTHAVLKVQSPESIAPFASSLVDIALSGESKQLDKLVDRGLDVALSVPPGAVAALTATVKDAFTGLSPESCESVPVPTTQVDRLRYDAGARADPEKLRALVEQWGSASKAIVRREAGICLPSPPALAQSLSSATQAVASAESGKMRALEVEAAATLKSVPKGQAFKLFTEWRRQQTHVLGRIPFLERDGLRKACSEYVAARQEVESLRRQKAAGPPRCFTIGCQTNYEYDLWRYSGQKDYTGDGLEKPNGILKPKGFTFDKVD